jgi:hypothetical protein
MISIEELEIRNCATRRETVLDWHFIGALTLKRACRQVAVSRLRHETDAELVSARMLLLLLLLHLVLVDLQFA